MPNLKLNLNTSDMILYHLLQRFVYQYHSLFSNRKTHAALEDLTQLWFIKIFTDNPYFHSMSQSVLVNYEIQENKDLLIVVRAPLYYLSFLISLDKDIKTCTTITTNEGSVSDMNLFTIEFE
jgi:hypothetical protein